MTKIRWLRQANNEKIYPVTHERAVRDNAGVTLDVKLSDLDDKTEIKSMTNLDIDSLIN